MSYLKLTTSWSVLLLLIGFMAGCYDSPVSVDGDSIEFPSERQNIDDSAYLSEIAAEATALGIEGYEESGLVTDRKTDEKRKDQAQRSNPIARANVVARRYLAILRTLNLTDGQWIRVRRYFAAYKECVENTTNTWSGLASIKWS